jgi:hypothetical protein
MTEPAHTQHSPSDASKASSKAESPQPWLELPAQAVTGRGRIPQIVQLQRVAGNRAVLQMVGRPVFIQRAHDYAETDASDHGAEDFDLNVNTENVSWWELTAQALQRRSDRTLGAVFVGMIPNQMRQQITNDILAVGYYQWKNGGIYTRQRFQELVMQMIQASLQGQQQAPQVAQNEDMVIDTKRDNGIIQLARTPNTYSVNGDYTGASNGSDYDNVIYLRDDDGNIAFEDDPADIVDDYNETEEPEIDEDDIKWEDPMDYGSKVQMSNDLTDPEYGLMPSGKKVQLKTATRPQHFAIADDLYNNDRAGTWTWHHLSDRYKMILVDMRVHAKHGHNGGVLLWNT